MLAGCGSPETPDGPDALVIVVGVHQGVPVIVAEDFEPEIASAVASGAGVAVIALDGTPAVAETFDPLTGSDLGNSVVKGDLTADILETLDGLEADSDGNDVSEALNLAADQVRTLSTTGGRILVFDSGLSDTGTPTMTTPDITTTNPQDVVDFIDSEGRAPKFPEGTTVAFYGLGYGTSPQLPLTQLQRDNVTAIWKGIVELGGGLVELIPGPRSGDGPSTSFTTVPVTPETPPQFTVTETDEGVEAQLSAEDVTFAGCSSELPASATAVLTQLLSLVQQSSGPVTITGHTASTTPCSPPYPDDVLSLDRAQAVASWLADQGVDSTRLTAIGAADSEPLPGLPASDPANRRVEVLIGRG